MTEYIIDGTNVAHWKERSVVSIIATVQIVIDLLKRGDKPYCIFDANTRHLVVEKEFYLECMRYTDVFKEVTGGIRADDFILLYANDNSCSCIISNDQFKDRAEQYPWLVSAEGKMRLIKGDVILDKLAIPGLGILRQLGTAASTRDELSNAIGELSRSEPIDARCDLPSPTEEDGKETIFSSPDGRFILSRLTIKDIVSKLEWSRNANVVAKGLTYAEANSVLEALNRQRYGGHEDWRFPRPEDYVHFLQYCGVDDVYEDYDRYSTPYWTYGYDCGEILDKEKFAEARREKGGKLVASLEGIGFIGIKACKYWAHHETRSVSDDISFNCSDMKDAVTTWCDSTDKLLLWPVRDLQWREVANQAL